MVSLSFDLSARNTNSVAPTVAIVPPEMVTTLSPFLRMPPFVSVSIVPGFCRTPLVNEVPLRFSVLRVALPWPVTSPVTCMCPAKVRLLFVTAVTPVPVVIVMTFPAMPVTVSPAGSPLPYTVIPMMMPVAFASVTEFDPAVVVPVFAAMPGIPVVETDDVAVAASTP